jgi:murein DD-endopeptidase MepM/ murein hydrolase activator NlpD
VRAAFAAVRAHLTASSPEPPLLPPSRTPRHAAPVPTQRRTVMVPAVLLLSVGAALGGLALLPSHGASLSVTAAASTSSIIVPEPQALADNPNELQLLKPSKPLPARAPVRASRARRLAAAPPEYVRPGVGVLTSGFKWRWGRMHTGIDLAGPYGSPVRAVTAGTVIEADQESGYGNIVKIQHADGVVTYYAHLSKILVHEGHVTAGQQIADEGDTGHSTGPHLHFEVRIDDRPIDPIPWLAGHGILI